MMAWQEWQLDRHLAIVAAWWPEFATAYSVVTEELPSFRDIVAKRGPISSHRVDA